LFWIIFYVISEKQDNFAAQNNIMVNRSSDYTLIRQSVSTTPSFDNDRSLVLNGDSLQLMKELPDHCVSLLLTDPPYHSTKKDNIVGDCSFKTDEDFLAWIRAYAVEWKRILKPNGSAFMFCSSAMEARLDLVLSEHFNVLSHIVWTKPNEPGYDGWKGKMKKEALRQWYPQSERIIFFEPASEGNMNRSYFGNLLREMRKQCGISAHELTEIIGAYGKVNHGGAVSNWETGRNVPSPEQYQKMSDAFKERGIMDGLPAYEDTIRPFEVNANVEFTDVWNFPSVKQYPGKHPAEKPIEMLEHCIKSTTFEGDIVLDCFAGSGSTLVAALRCHRRAIGMEIDRQWCKAIQDRLSTLSKVNINTTSGYKLMKGSSQKKTETAMPSLFDMELLAV